MPEHINELINREDVEILKGLSNPIQTILKRLDLWLDGPYNVNAAIHEYSLCIFPGVKGRMGDVFPNYYKNLGKDFSIEEMQERIGVNPEALLELKLLEIDTSKRIQVYQIITKKGDPLERQLNIYETHDSWANKKK